MIPQDKMDGVARGLREAFGAATYEDIAEVTGGHTPSLVFRIVVRGSPYLLKIITRAEDPTRHYRSMRAAADAGVAPRVWYTDTAEKISITDFVEAVPRDASQALVALPALLRRLHALPPFGRAPFNTTCTFLLNGGPALDGKFPARDGFLQKFRESGALPDADRDKFFTRLAELIAVLPNDEREMVASHNDLFKPDNILFDGRQLWLVDWEAAFLNDRYADLAAVANHVVTNDEDERTYLREYFGASPDRYERARFHLMQQLVHLFYTMAFLYSTATPIDWHEPVPDFAAYHRRMWMGEIDLSDKNVKTVFGRVHWQRFLENVKRPRYSEALKLVADGPAIR